MVMMGKCYLTEDEAVMLGCLKMQVGEKVIYLRLFPFYMCIYVAS